MAPLRLHTLCYLLLLPCLLLVHSCDEDEESTLDFKRSYFPTNVGHWVIYDVDSINVNSFTQTRDTSSFQLREVIESEFTDITGQPSQRIERYKRRNDSTAWELIDVWSQTRSDTRAERVEENLRFIKLVFPPIETREWKGNSLFTFQDEEGCDYLGDWDYAYSDVDAPLVVGNLVFDSTLTVTQVDEEFFTCKNQSVEVYARNVGLVSKTLVRLIANAPLDPNSGITASDPIELRANKGFQITYTLRAFGN